jgi:hypothetical protein
MKKIKIVLFVAALSLLSSSGISAQVHINININSQPQWGPDNYDYVEYYYLPEAGIYYYAPKAQFIYRQGNRWVYAYHLPNQYRNLNLYTTYKVVVNEPRPYLRHTYYVSHYKGYGNRHSRQETIRDSKNTKYRKENSSRNFSGNSVGKSPQNKKGQSSSGTEVGKDGQNKQNKQDVQGDRKKKGNKKDSR